MVQSIADAEQSFGSEQGLSWRLQSNPFIPTYTPFPPSPPSPPTPFSPFTPFSPPTTPSPPSPPSLPSPTPPSCPTTPTPHLHPNPPPPAMYSISINHAFKPLIPCPLLPLSPSFTLSKVESNLPILDSFSFLRGAHLHFCTGFYRIYLML